MIRSNSVEVAVRGNDSIHQIEARDSSTHSSRLDYRLLFEILFHYFTWALLFANKVLKAFAQDLFLIKNIQYRGLYCVA